MREVQFIKESNTRKPRDFFRVKALFVSEKISFYAGKNLMGENSLVEAAYA